MFYREHDEILRRSVQQISARRRLNDVVRRSVATQLVERLALIALACGSILVLLPAVLRAVATD